MKFCRDRTRHAARLWLLSLPLLTLPVTVLAQQQEAPSPCGPVAIPGHYGPYDYVSEAAKVVIVNQGHFTNQVENLHPKGQTGYLGADLTYTLNASPNHHRALATLMAYGAKTKSLQPPHMGLTIECYFDRAVRFRPEDGVVRALFGLYLHQINRTNDGLKQMAAAAHFAGDDGQRHHSIGLGYLEMGRSDLALQQAHRALKLGFPSVALVEKLKAGGQWQEP